MTHCDPAPPNPGPDVAVNAVCLGDALPAFALGLGIVLLIVIAVRIKR